MAMIPITEIHGNQFMKARVLMLPVVVINGHMFRMPSSSSAEREHVVTFDSGETPTACSCTCAAGLNQTPCWAMARALDTLTVLSINQIYIASPGAGTQSRAGEIAPGAATAAAAQSYIGTSGELVLMTKPVRAMEMSGTQN